MPEHAPPTVDEQSPPTLVGRRALVRAGVATAWAVPLVQVAGLAPALAASGKSLLVTAVLGSWSNNSTNGTVPLTVTVTNTGSVAVTVSTVSLQFPSGWNPNCSNVSGWSRSGNSSNTVTYSRTPANLAPNATLTLAISSVNPDNAAVGTGTYVEDGEGLTVVAISTTTGVTVTPAVIDIPGLYPNLVMTGTAAWSQTGGQYYLTATASVRNRGRTATADLDVVGTVEGCGTSTGTAQNVASGWTFRTSPDTHYERTGSELAQGQSAVFTSTRQMTGAEAGTSGTLTLTPRDQGSNNEEVHAASIAVPGFSGRMVGQRSSRARSAQPF